MPVFRSFSPLLRPKGEDSKPIVELMREVTGG